MNKKALLIGINYIGTPNELRGCINDIIHMKDYLINECGFQNNEIIMLHEATNNKKPTRQNIINYINWLVQNNNENSRLFFHYSGHGSYIYDRNSDEKDGRDEVICPLDMNSAGIIVDDELKNLLVNPLKHGAKLTCLFDCCHSGTVLDLKYTYKVSNIARLNQIENDNHYTDSQGNVMLISGCLDTQTSADAYEAGMFQGALTYSFLESIKNIKKLGLQPSIENLIKYLLEFIGRRGYSQIPQLSSGNLINLSDLFSIL